MYKYSPNTYSGLLSILTSFVCLDLSANFYICMYHKHTIIFFENINKLNDFIQVSRASCPLCNFENAYVWLWRLANIKGKLNNRSQRKKCRQPINRTNTHDRTNAKIAFHCIHVSKLLDRQSIFSVLFLCTCNEFLC